MTIEGINTEGVLIFANVTKCKSYYADKAFDYNYPKGLSELLQQGIIHIITTDEIVEQVDFVFNKEEIDTNEFEYHESYNYLKVAEGDEIRALSHADFTQMCHSYKGNLEEFVEHSLALKNILHSGKNWTKESYFEYEVPLIELPVGNWKINVYALKDEHVMSWMEFYIHLEQIDTVVTENITLEPLELYA